MRQALDGDRTTVSSTLQPIDRRIVCGNRHKRRLELGEGPIGGGRGGVGGAGVMGNTRCVRIVAGQLVVATSLGRRRGGGGGGTHQATL